MRFNKLVGTMAAATISLATMTGVAHAQATTFAGVSNLSGTSATYTKNTGLSFDPSATWLFNSAGFIDTTAALSFTGVNVLGVNGPTSVIGTDFTQNLFGGNFFIRDTTNVLSETYLSGTFSGATLKGPLGEDGGGNLTTVLNSVTFTGGTKYPATGLGLSPLNSFTFALEQVNPVFGVTTSPNSLNGFTASASGLFKTPTAVPEPSEWLAMGMAATSVGGLMFRSKMKLRSKRQQIAA